MRNRISYNLVKLLLLALLAISINSCYQPKTHGRFLSESTDAWIDGYAIRIDEHKVADRGLVFCRANVQENGSAKPSCFKAEFHENK
jgi:hypothetical protein